MCRLEAQHAVLCKIFDQRLVFPPVAAPSRILDCGCGAGDWAVDVANQFPDAEVSQTFRVSLGRSSSLIEKNIVDWSSKLLKEVLAWFSIPRETRQLAKQRRIP